MTTRTRYSAEYLYPGVFMPESATATLPDPDFETAVAYASDEGWYAVRIYTITEKLFVAIDGEEIWAKDGNPKVEKIIIGTEVSVDDPSISSEEYNILRRNIEYNGTAVRTRVGNFQFRKDWDRVEAP